MFDAETCRPNLDLISMTEQVYEPRPQRCPICGNLNGCGVAAGKGTCWCFTRPIPENALEKIPDGARELACICEVCAFARKS